MSRRTFTSSGATEVSGDEAIDVNYYGEGDSRSVAYNQIGEFKTSATNNGGYYIGRYEQGEGNVCKSGVNPYANITRDQAKSQAEAMYNGNSYITSELISSYAWDTALNFICQTNSTGYVLATTTSNKYGNIATDSKTQTGKYEADKYNNIYDLLGNCIEWSTEHSTSSTGNSVTRGAPYVAAGYVAVRTPSAINSSMEYCSFRVQLYL